MPDPSLASKRDVRRATSFARSALVLAVMVAFACSRPKDDSNRSSPLPQVKTRRSVAVLGFKNRSGRADVAWLSTALAEILTRELAAGEQVRAISGENVARMRIDLALPESERLTGEILRHVHENLGTDLLILGSYSAGGKGAAGKFRIDVLLEDARSGSTLAQLTEEGNESELRNIATRVVTRLGPSLGKGPAGQTQAAQSAAPSAPENVDAIRLQAEGLAKLRSFDPSGARELLERAVAADPSVPQSHTALAAAWAALGYDMKAKEEAKKAFDLSAALPRSERLVVEGRYHEAFKSWDEAIEDYQKLVDLFPDNLDYGLRLAETLSTAGKGKEALDVIETLRRLPPPASEDPRIDLAEATAAHSLSDYRRSQGAAARAATRSSATGSRLLLAQARFQEGRAAARAGDPAKAISACETAKAMFAEVGDRAGVARSLNLLANVFFDQGDLFRARTGYEEALSTYRALGNRSGTAAALNNLAVVLVQQGETAAAREKYEQSLAIFREVGDRRNAAVTLNNIGEILQQEGDLGGAGTMYEESLEIRRGTGDKWGVAGSLNDIATLRMLRGDLAAADKAYQEALTISTEIGSKSRQADTLIGLGSVATSRGEFSDARKKFDQALTLRKSLGEKGGIAEASLAIARLSLEEGHSADAETSARQAVSEFEEVKRPSEKAFAYVALALSLFDQGKLMPAQEAIDQALKLSAKSRNVELRLTAGLCAARVGAAAGRQVEASLRARDTLDIAAKAGLVVLQLEARLLIGEIELKSGKPTSGRQRLQSVEKDASALGLQPLALRAKKACV